MKMASKKRIYRKKAQKKEDEKAKESIERLCSAMDTLGNMVSQEMQMPDRGLEKYNDMEKEALSMTDKDKKAEILDKITEEKELRRKAEMQIAKIDEEKYRESFNDGDQTPLKGNARKIMHFKWASGMDYSPYNPRSSHWLRVLIIGDYSAMMKIVERTQKEDIQQLLERRESGLNMGAIFHVINGAKMLCGDSEEHAEFRKKFNNGRNDHMACFLKLLELGVKINSKDVAGFTPLHHCLTKFVNDVTMKMAKILLKNGANVNEQNRFGCTPLVEPTVVGKLEVLEMLVNHGADPSIPDNDGKNCFGIHKFWFPKMEEIFSKASYAVSKDKRKEAIEECGGSLTKCVGCGSMDKDNKRCKGCYLVWYCERPCQQRDWENHKKACKETKKKYVPVIIRREKVMTAKNLKTGKVYVCRDTDIPSASHFLVKIQVTGPLATGHDKVLEVTGHAQDSLHLYNKDRSLLGDIPPEDSSYAQLVTIIKERGPLGCKGFFYAIWNDNALKINITDIQTPQTW